MVLLITVAQHHAVGNKTIPVFRKQCFTFTFGVGISHTQATPGHSVSDQGQKLCFYFSFLNGKATNEAGRRRRWGRGEQQRGNRHLPSAPGTSIRDHVMYSTEPDPATCTKDGCDCGLPHRDDRDQKHSYLLTVSSKV